MRCRAYRVILPFTVCLIAVDGRAFERLDRVEEVLLGGTGYLGVQVSPDGEHVYVASPAGDSVTVLDRDPGDGTVVVLQTLADGIGGIVGLAGASNLALSPDGAHVYVASDGEDALAVLARNAGTGELTLVEVERDGIGGVDGLAGAVDVVVSPDGSHVYVTGRLDDAVAAFSRSAMTGELTQIDLERNGLGGVDRLAEPEQIAIAPDGGHVYVGSIGGYLDSGGVVTFARDGVGGGLSYVVSTDEVWRHVAVSPDGAQVYAGARPDRGFGIIAFDRDAGTGMLTVAQRLMEGSQGLARLDNMKRIAPSPDGRHVHVLTAFLNVLFERDTATGLLAHQYTTGSLPLALEGSGIAPSPDSRHLYVAAPTSLRVGELRTVACSATPIAPCRAPAVPARGTLSLTPSGAVKWKWLGGAATTLAEFGSPGGGDPDYVLCLYDAGGASQPLLDAAAPAAGFCRNRGCWMTSTISIKYLNRARPDGLSPLRLQPGGDGEARVIAGGGGPRLDPPALPLTPPVVAQLQNSESGCWQATYSAPVVNDGTRFRATAD